MTNQEISTKLHKAGFIVKQVAGFIVVSLNRPISKMEVNSVFNHELPNHSLTKSGNSVVIIGQES